MEERLARLEGRVEELSKRLDDLRNDINHRFEGVDKRIDDLRDSVNRRFEEFRDDINNRFSHMQWEVRMWFLVLMVLVTILTFLKP